LADATHDPAGYLHALSLATEAGELTAVGGLGDFFWSVTSTVGAVFPPAGATGGGSGPLAG
jgi:hypothetical protein